MAQKLKDRQDSISTQIAVIITNIIGIIEQLIAINNCSCHHIKHLKGQFNTQFTNILFINTITTNESLMIDIENVNDNIVALFKKLRHKRVALQEFKEGIAKAIEQFNAALYSPQYIDIL